MNTMLIAAVLGWLVIEFHFVRKGLKAEGSPDRFNWRYYLERNWPGLLMNALGTAMIYMMSDAVMLAERHMVSRWTSDPALVQQLTDALLIPVTGGVIGLFGARVVRYAIGKGKVLDTPE